MWADNVGGRLIAGTGVEDDIEVIIEGTDVGRSSSMFSCFIAGVGDSPGELCADSVVLPELDWPDWQDSGLLGEHGPGGDPADTVRPLRTGTNVLAPLIGEPSGSRFLKILGREDAVCLRAWDVSARAAMFASLLILVLLSTGVENGIWGRLVSTTIAGLSLSWPWGATDDIGWTWDVACRTWIVCCELAEGGTIRDGWCCGTLRW